MSPWIDLLTPADIAKRRALTASLDPRFAASEQAFWESRSVPELRTIAAGAWLANNPDSYQMARSLIALAGESLPDYPRDLHCAHQV